MPASASPGRKEPYRWSFRHGVPIVADCYLSSDDADLLVGSAKAGLGLLYTTDWHVGPMLASGELVEVLAQWPVADDGAIYVLTPATHGMANKTRAFSDLIAAGLAARPWLQAPGAQAGGTNSQVMARSDVTFLDGRAA